MNEEKNTIKEAKDFWEILEHNSTPIEKFQSIKNKLENFYSTSNKVIFLDELKKIICKELQHHRDKKHGGKPKENCFYEISTQKLLLSINQELLSLNTTH